MKKKIHHFLKGKYYCVHGNEISFPCGGCNPKLLPKPTTPNEQPWEEFDKLFAGHSRLLARNGYYKLEEIKDFIRSKLSAEREKYNELILAVVGKFEGETRHETALRYIREREAGSSQAARTNP